MLLITILHFNKYYFFMSLKTIKEFKITIEDLIRLISSLNDEELNRIPFPNSWTAGQIGDHLLKSFHSWDVLKGTTSAPDRPVDENCKPLSELFLNFEIKMQAEPSDFNYPTNDFIIKHKLLSDLRKITNDIIEFSNQHPLGLLCLNFKLPTFGYLTRLEWLHFYTVHTQRHNHQLKNIINHLKNENHE